jgi:hypothetical protein
MSLVGWLLHNILLSWSFAKENDVSSRLVPVDIVRLVPTGASKLMLR